MYPLVGQGLTPTRVARVPDYFLGEREINSRCSPFPEERGVVPKDAPAGEQGFQRIARALARGAGAAGAGAGAGVVVSHGFSGLIHRIKLQKNPTQGGEVKETHLQV